MRMGNCSSTEDQKKSRIIDDLIKSDKKKSKSEIKLLLLGPGESGKSTIFKQMKLIQINGGFTSEELQSYKYIVYGNCVSQMKVLVAYCLKEGKQFTDPENMQRAERLSKVPPTGDSWSPNLGEDIKQLWKDPVILEIYGQRNRQFQLDDSSQYFFDNIDRFINPNYIPNTADVLRSRIRSTGIEEAEFKFLDVSFRMLDVGGQRSERKKWLHCFESVTAVIFCVALSEYDQTLREDETQNRMRESILLFDQIVNSPWFKSTTFILFLNKIDLFKQKIEKVDLRITFPNYEGGTDFEAASNFIKQRFLEQNQFNSHVIFTHFTCAISTENIEFVFKCVRETVLKRILDEVIL